MTTGRLIANSVFVYPDDEPLVFVNALAGIAFDAPVNHPDEIFVVDEFSLIHGVEFVKTSDERGRTRVRWRRGFATLNYSRLTPEERPFGVDDTLRVGGLVLRGVESDGGVLLVAVEQCPGRIVNACTHRQRFRWTVS